METCDNTEELISFRKPRCLSDLLYSQNHPAAKEIRCGELERRTRIFRFYNTGFYVLTPSGFLHEFKSENLKCDQIPIMSLYLREYEISDYSPADSHSYKFSLKGYKSEYSRRAHTYVFRVKTYQELLDWYNDIKKFAGRSYMSDKEFRDYIVALQIGNIVNSQVLESQSRQGNHKELLLLASDHDSNNDVGIMAPITDVSNATEESQVSDMECEENEMNNEHRVDCVSLDKESELSTGLSDGVVFSEQKNSGNDRLTHTPILLNTAVIPLNGSGNSKEEASLKSSLKRDSSYYSSTDECPCPLKTRDSSFDSEHDLDEQLNDMQKSSCQGSDSLHVLSESQIDNQKLKIHLSDNLYHLPSQSVTIESKFKENLEKSISSNIDVINSPENNLELKKSCSSVSSGSIESLMNVVHDPSNVSSIKVSDDIETSLSS
ncbi:hypothetical protein PCK1_000111 [Pneumocystis canis]|nr:hypothetical protein PCK1_000111 [Pneumocystis canis]